MESKSAFAGFLAAPLVTAFIFVFFGGTPGGILFWLFVAYICAFLAMIVFALPLFVLLFAWNLIRWWSCLISGALIGALVAWFVRGNTLDIEALIPLSLAGAASGLSFWMIWWVGTDRGLATIKSLCR